MKSRIKNDNLGSDLSKSTIFPLLPAPQEHGTVEKQLLTTIRQLILIVVILVIALAGAVIYIYTDGKKTDTSQQKMAVTTKPAKPKINYWQAPNTQAASLIRNGKKK
jgi:flagellar basal body-associated protein FliL